MATDFFTDVFDSFTGQKPVPQQTITPTADLLAQGYGTSIGLAPQMIAYNQALAPGLTNVQLGVESQYDPNAAALRAATSRSILDELNLGTSLGQELQEDVIRNALEGSAASGFGVGQGGRGLVARDLGLTGLELGARRRGEAQGAVNQQASLASLYNPTGLLNPAAVASDIRGVQAAQDEYANLKESIRRDNFASLLNTGGRIIGGIIGGVATSGSPMGIEAGKSIGGSIFQGSGGYSQQQAAQGAQGSSFLTGLLSGGKSQSGGGGNAWMTDQSYKSIGGPSYGIGAR